MFWHLLLLAALVCCSFFVSGSETALFALSNQDRRAFAASTSPLKHLACRLMRRPRRVLTTVLIVNTAVNIGIFAVSYVMFDALGKTSAMLAALGGVAALLVVIIFGEIIPKAVALASARQVAPVVAPIIRGAEVVTTPLRAVLQFLLIEPLTRLLSAPRPHSAQVTSEDLRALVQLSAEQGIITSREHDMLQVVVALPEVPVRAVMVPRVDMKAAGINSPIDDIRKTFRETGFKKLPVYDRDLDDVVGMLYARDLYLRPEEPIRDLLRPVKYVPEVIDLLQLIRFFRDTGAQIAIVVDEYGGVSGLVALEDVFEEIVGELDAAHRTDPDNTVERLDERTYRLNGALGIRPWRESLGITGMFTTVDTIGGVVLASLGRMPRVGDQVRFGNLSIIVDHIDNRRIDRVLLRIDDSADVSQEAERT